MKKRYLLATWDGGGVIPPALSLMRKLVERGHTVRVLSDPTVEEEARAVGCDFSPWTSAPHRTSRHRDADILRDYAKSKPEHLRDMLRDFFADPVPRWTNDVLGELHSHPADVVVADAFLPGALVAAEKLGLASAALVTTPYCFPSKGIPPMGMGLLPATSALGHLRDRALHAIGNSLLWSKILIPLNETRAAHNLAPVASYFAQLDHLDRVLVLSSPAFDFTSPHVPANVRWVGAELDDPSWAAEWTSPFDSTDGRPLVLVALSSTFMAQIPVLRRIVAALSTLPVKAVVTLGLAVSPDEVPGSDNVVVVQTAPHGAILQQAALAISHCGHGTALKTAAAGVPLVCIPMGRDQSDVAVRVTSRGAGVSLKPNASVEAISKAVCRLLDEPGYTDAARGLAGAIREDGAASGVLELEALGCASATSRSSHAA